MDLLLYIENGLEYNLRKNWGRLFFIWSILFLSLALNSIFLGLPFIYEAIFEVLFILFLVLYMVNGMMKMIFLHEYKDRIIGGTGRSYEASLVREKGRAHKDDVAGLIHSSYGDQIMKRLGIRRESLEHYLERRRHKNRIQEQHLPEDGFDLQEYVLLVYDNDDHFQSYLKNERVLRNDLAHASLLVQNVSALEKEGDRFWSNLQLHGLSPFERELLNVERSLDLHFTTPVFRRLSVLDEEEKFQMLRRIISNAKNSGRRNVLVSDI